MNSILTKVKAPPLVEVPAAAVRAAAPFAAPGTAGLGGVVFRPGDEDGYVEILAASPTKLITVTAEGSCEREIAIPAPLLTTMNRRHSDADVLTVADGLDGVGLLVRSYSSGATLQMVGPEDRDCAVSVPDFKPGPHEVSPLHFNPNLVKSVLNALNEADQLTMEPFSLGLIIRGSAERWWCRTFLAGIAGEQ